MRVRSVATFMCLVASLALGACGGGSSSEEEEVTDTSGSETVVEAEPEPEPEPQPPAPSPVRVIHAAAGISGEPVSGDASGMASFEAVAFASASPYAEVAPSEPMEAVGVSISAEGGASVDTQAPLTAGTPTTIVVYSGADGGLAALALPDEAGSVTGQVRGRFVNALLGTEALDLCLPGASRRAAGTPIISGVAYGDFGGIPAFPSRFQPMNLAGVEQ
ncbi:MAG: DUF4397 domain-containing protein, partial [Sandaracinaceae bacterium]